MKTLEEHFDDLDRMVDTGASKPAIRDQIVFLWKQVAALQADDASKEQRLVDVGTAFQELQTEHEALKKQSAKCDAGAWQRLARESHIEATYAPENSDAS